ncbi:MAG TPA: hypothetical protein VFP31_13715 [Gaiellaceae bacterium]|nr:hypothetical protein [Gaiellaceae bacterium]
MIVRGLATVTAVVLALSSAAAARASEPLPDLNVRAPTLKVNGKRALVEYTTTRGARRHVFVWGALNAHVPPRANVRQVRFRYDFAGGWRIARKQLWRMFRNACRRYDGPPLPYVVAACKAPDGSYWALQSWQRRLPLLGFEPWLPSQDDFELHVSHWNTELPVLEAYVKWTYGFQWQGVFGRLSYLGHPVHGFSSSTIGNPRDRYARNVYIDTLNSGYGPGWRRESGVLTHRGTGTFCHSFVSGQRPHAGYPSSAPRPSSRGERYRISVMGPGVTPTLMWEAAGLPPFNGSSEHHTVEQRANAAFDRVMAGDRICARER